MEPKLQRRASAKAASGFPVRAGAREEKYRAWLYTPLPWYRTVSYTHLDVYKRQPQQCLKRFPCFGGGDVLFSFPHRRRSFYAHDSAIL